MSDFALYVPASKSRRFGALFSNALLLGLLGTSFDYPGLPEVKNFVIPIILLLLLVFCVFPESPGKRLFNLKILDEEKKPIDAMQRIYRSLPYILFYSVLGMGNLLDLQSRTGMVIVGLTFMLTLVFLSANAFAVLFSPDGRSLLDMRLRTRVFTPRTIPGLESPKLFGTKIW